MSTYRQEYEGKLAFTTDAWTSPNHRSFVALCVHLEHKGAPLSMVLDVVQVAKSHTGVHLAEAFAGVLEEFGINKRVRARPAREAELTELFRRKRA